MKKNINTFEKAMLLTQLAITATVALATAASTVVLIANQGIHWHTLAFVAINIILCVNTWLIAKEYKEFVKEQ